MQHTEAEIKNDDEIVMLKVNKIDKNESKTKILNLSKKVKLVPKKKIEANLPRKNMDTVIGIGKRSRITLKLDDIVENKENI